jgi:hypothetical protein
MRSHFGLPVNFSVHLPKWKLAAVVFGDLPQIGRRYGQIFSHDTVSPPVDAVADHAVALIL